MARLVDIYMYILKEGRAAYLEFLRNLTPQILMLTLAFFLGQKIDFTQFDLAYTTPTLIFYSFLLIAIFAAYANATLFMEKYSPSLQVRRGVQKIIKTRVGKQMWVMQLLYFRRRWIVLLEAMLLIFVVELAIAGAFIVALTSASKMTF